MAKCKYNTKAVRLSQEIVNHIKQGDYAAGSMLPSETKLGEIYNASRITIRRSLNALAAQGVVERIPHRGVVVCRQPGSQQRRAITPQKTTFASVITTRPDEAMIKVQEGIQNYVNEHGLRLQFISPVNDSENLFDLLSGKQALELDGVIVLPYPGDNNIDILEGIEKRGIPVVCVEKRSNDIKLPSVEPDNISGMYRAVNYLIQKYRRPVYYLGMKPDHKTDHDRYKGYVCSMMDAGYQKKIASHTCLHAMKSSDPIYWKKGEDWRYGYEVALPLLKKSEIPVSLACVKDYFAWGVYKAAEEIGLVIGRDINVTGFDDLTISQMLEPKLTTVRQPLRDKGYQAARLLHRRIIDDSAHKINICLPVELVIRDSA